MRLGGLNLDNMEDLAKIANDWNKTNSIGTKVMRYKLINPLREGNETL